MSTVFLAACEEPASSSQVEESGASESAPRQPGPSPAPEPVTADSDDLVEAASRGEEEMSQADDGVGEAPSAPHQDTGAVTLEDIEKNIQEEEQKERRMPRPRPIYGTPRIKNPYR